MLEIEPATEVDEKWTVIWMHEQPIKTAIVN
jgi:hypothetical protein